MLARWSVRFALFLMAVSFILGWYVSSVHRGLPDFAEIHSFQRRQHVFAAFLLPLGRNANRAVLWQRHKVERLHVFWQKHHHLVVQRQAWLARLAKQYQLRRFSVTQSRDWSALLARVDMVPLSMMLAQAANESAWGTSRFAQQGNNLFGRWCFTAGCGFVPQRRPKGARYEVKVFKNAYASVQDYLHNLNTNPAYAELRAIRADYRRRHLPLTGAALVGGLGQYSQKGQRYVQLIGSIMRDYGLAKYDRPA